MDTTTETDENGIDHPAEEFPPDQPANHQPDPSSSKEINENHSMTRHRGRLVTFYGKVAGTSFTISDVRHYAEYTIEVRACHDFDPSSNKTLCSKTAVAQARTKQKGIFLSFLFSCRSERKHSTLSST